MTGRGTLARTWRSLAGAAVIVFFTASLAELTLLAVRHLPALSRSRAIQPLGWELYLKDRALVQYLSGCAQYDVLLGYTLRPGSCVFSNTEYRTTFRINRLGVRYSEEALRGPEVVVTGDSFAMGWGVEEDQTFARILGKESGLKVLDTAIASYGTARELLLLTRADLSRARFLVIQFCNNDYVENEAYQKNGNHLPVMTRETYEGTVRDQARDRRYVPFKYLAATLGSRLARLRPSKAPPDPTPSPDDPEVRRRQVDYFLNCLLTSPVDLSRLRIVVFEMNAHNQDATWFIPMLKERIAKGTFPEHVRNLSAVDVARSLTRADFYVLDDHLTPAGHRKVAALLLPYLKR